MSQSLDASKLELHDAPDDFRGNTSKAQCAFTNKPQGSAVLTKPSHFKRKYLWFFFWVVTNAAHTAAEQAGSPIDENTLSGNLVRALDEQMRTLQTEAQKRGFAPLFEFKFSNLYTTRAPAAREPALGADILLLVSGNTLLQKEGIFLFWIQAKLNTNKRKSFTMDVSQSNKDGPQIDALLKTHVQAVGSEALYLLFAAVKPFLTVASVTDVKALSSAAPGVVDVSTKGVRFQEYLTEKIAGVKAVQLMDEATLLAFLDEKSQDAPYYIAALSSQRGMAQTLIDRVQAYYAAKYQKLMLQSAAKDVTSSPSP